MHNFLIPSGLLTATLYFQHRDKIRGGWRDLHCYIDPFQGPRELYFYYMSHNGNAGLLYIRSDSGKLRLYSKIHYEIPFPDSSCLVIDLCRSYMEPYDPNDRRLYDIYGRTSKVGPVVAVAHKVGNRPANKVAKFITVGVL